jgi:peroxiredoxin Q/BCP
MLEAGMKAPEFALPDKNGRTVSLSDFRGKKVVLYFYPKDSTSGCTRQALAYAQTFEEFKKRGVEVIGISRDSAASHARFAEKNDLPFILVSDTERTAIESYGVWQEKKNYGKVSMGVVRSSFVIDENGVILRAAYKVKPDTDASDVLEFLG